MSASRIFLVTVLAFLTGVLIHSFIEIPSSVSWFLMFIGLCFIAVGFSKRRTQLMLYGAFLVALVAGIFRFSASLTIPEEVAAWYGYEQNLSGIVWDEPKQKGQTQELIVKIFKKENGSAHEPFFIDKSFFILVRTRAYPIYFLGDELFIRGRLERPPHGDTFDYAAYLAKDGIHAVMGYPTITRHDSSDSTPLFLRVKKILFAAKYAFVKKLEAIIPEPYAAFLSGLLIGTRSHIPPDSIAAMQRTGTMHLIALSGFNISIIADNLLKILQWLMIPFSGSFWIAVGFVVAFTVMTGASASLVRAAIMGILILVARKSGRLYDARLALVAAAGLMVLHKPGILRFDLGFQLSFLATIGIIFIAPRLQERFERYVGTRIASLAAPTFGAQLAVLPLLMYAFGNVSIISPIANFLVLAVIPATMLIGFIAVSMSFISMWLGIFAGLIAWLLLVYETGVIRFLARIPFASVEISFFSGIGIMIVYLFILKKIMIRSS